MDDRLSILEEIAELAAEVVESRKLFDAEQYEEYALVGRSKLNQLYWLLYSDGKVFNRFADPEYYMEEHEM